MNISVVKKADQRLMSGFQLPYSGKFIKLLIENNYTVIKDRKKAGMAIRDTLDVVGGKWKLILISIMREGPVRFKIVESGKDNV